MISNLASSFRDPAGFVFNSEGGIKRAISFLGKDNYELLIGSGLYSELVAKHWIIPHRESDTDATGNDQIYKIIIPDHIPVISYPYEWSFTQFKDAALLTLDIQSLALRHGMSLKDATPYNIQFIGTNPVHIDTLSFEKLDENAPWTAYKQFCESFLAPLALMAGRSLSFNRYLSVDINGMDLNFCSRLLPWRSWFNITHLLHIHLHALAQKKYAGKPAKKNSLFTKRQAEALAGELRSGVRSLRPKKERTVWSRYYSDQKHYSDDAENFKISQVSQWLESQKPRLVLDLGGNNGKYSRISSEMGIYSVCIDSDPYCVDENYLASKERGDSSILPLLLDLSSPSPDIGWNGVERDSIFRRIRPDMTLALALLHHLRIRTNAPIPALVKFFERFTGNIIIEFVPKEDPMAEKLFEEKNDNFRDYTKENFEKCIERSFKIVHKAAIPGTLRALYLLNNEI